jgi:hypothetical protein
MTPRYSRYAPARQAIIHGTASSSATAGMTTPESLTKAAITQLSSTDASPARSSGAIT